MMKSMLPKHLAHQGHRQRLWLATQTRHLGSLVTANLCHQIPRPDIAVDDLGVGGKLLSQNPRVPGLESDPFGPKTFRRGVNLLLQLQGYEIAGDNQNEATDALRSPVI